MRANTALHRKYESYSAGYRVVAWLHRWSGLGTVIMGVVTVVSGVKLLWPHLLVRTYLWIGFLCGVLVLLEVTQHVRWTYLEGRAVPCCAVLQTLKQVKKRKKVDPLDFSRVVHDVGDANSVVSVGPFYSKKVGPLSRLRRTA